ncbi:unnamed protein product [Adineta steineri]|uniref:Uncharacterized protein n=1 Tax=Adineta steineri TaxID=433720 RepID=A0A813QDD5_9BILA|nr:unnamed protein product [Adineta steineri]CAF0922713.1 unnamed protein product [Adineta steineri]
MCSRLIFRSIQHPIPSVIFSRFLSLTQIQLNAATKLKEKSSIDVEITKTYSENIQRIVNEISKLSLVEVMDLNELLKRKLNIQDVPIVASGGSSGSPPPTTPKKDDEEDEGARPVAQSVFKVRLIKYDDTKKVPVIKQVKDVVENINLVQAKKLVESIPQVLRDNLSKADAEKMKAKIEAVGGVCVIE